MVHESLRIIREVFPHWWRCCVPLSMMVERGPGNAPDPFFDVLRAMLLYIDEFPEKLHHPKESDLLFPKVLKAAPVAAALERLERDHVRGESAVRELQHHLLAWELLAVAPRCVRSRRTQLCQVLPRSHAARREEKEGIYPQAERALSEQDWVELDAAFASNRDPLNPNHPRDPVYDRLFTRIVMIAPEPIGLGSTR